MDRLISGYRRFRASGWPAQQKLFESLAKNGQHPKTLVVACVDSRVDPAMIFDAAPGEFLTVRNVANLVPPYLPNTEFHGTSAAIEFGVRVMGVEHVTVLGHGLCGGVKSLLEGAPENARDFVEPWMSMASAARERAFRVPAEDRQRRGELEVVKVSLGNLMTFPWVAEAVAEGRLKLHGAWFDVHSGVLMVMREDGSFAEAE
jgi:carbonic anhydrase